MAILLILLILACAVVYSWTHIEALQRRDTLLRRILYWVFLEYHRPIYERFPDFPLWFSLLTLLLIIARQAT